MKLFVPTSFSDCQNTQCKKCKFGNELDWKNKVCYWDSCKHRKEFEVQDKQ